MHGLAHIVHPRRPHGPGLPDARAEGWPEVEEMIEEYTPQEGRADHRHPGGGYRARGAHLRRGRERLHLLGPRGHRAPLRLGGRAPHLQPRAHDRQDRQAGLRAAAAARAEQRAGLVRHGRAAGHVHHVPLGRRRGRRARPSRRRGASRSRARRAEIPQMFDAAVAGDLQGDVHLRRGRRADGPRHRTTSSRRSESLEFLVCQDIFENETTKFADVMLPGSAFLEKEGTFTNAERRLQLVASDHAARQARRPTSRSSRPCRRPWATRWTTGRRPT